MKKLVLKLLALSLCASGLSSCSLSEIFGGNSYPEETREFNMSLRDYSSTIIQNSKYEYDGKVYVVYLDDNSEKDITDLCKYSAIDTSKLGSVTLKVSYETKKFIKSTTTILTVVPAPVLDSIELKNANTSVKLGDAYTYTGSVIAHYTEGTPDKDVTSSAIFDYSNINTSVAGEYTLKVSYKEGSITKEATTKVTVYEEMPKISSIKASEYTSKIDKGETYVFDGKVIATYVGGATADVTKDCTFSSVDTSSAGNKTLTISIIDYSNNSKTVKTTVTIEVIAHLVSISGAAVSVGEGRQQAIALTYEPSDVTNKNIASYISNNESVATVDSSGNVTGVSAGTTTITVTAEEKKANGTSITCNVSVEVTEATGAEWTLLIYVCGSDLESAYKAGYGYYGLASEDIKEIVGVSGQPDDVNIVIETGGASTWKSGFDFTISSSKIERWHVANKKLVKDKSLSYTSMGSSSTLSSFISWGLTEYPADKVGLVLWNHGGAMTGCCFDEKKDNDALTPYELSQGVKSGKSSAGYTKNFEFIGYDCCLMQVQDIAGLNSEYANYQVASEESEWGYGWSYDTWIDDLYAKKPTETILKAIVDGFKDATTEAYTEWGDPNDQTLSYIDLTKWEAYETAWEDMASTLGDVVTSSSKWNTFGNLLETCQRFGVCQDTDDYGYPVGDPYYPFDVFDVKDFFNKIKNHSTYKSNSELMDKIDACSAALSDLICYSWHGSASPNAYGLTMFAPVSGYSSKADYSYDSTPLSTWRDICVDFGSWAY